MSFSTKQVEDFYLASAKGGVIHDMNYLNQRGRGSKKMKRKRMYPLNQQGFGTTVVSPVEQNIQQVRSEIQHKKSIKRGRSTSTAPKPKRRRTVKTSSKKKAAPKKKTRSTKRKVSKRKKAAPKKKKTTSKKTLKPKRNKTKGTIRDVFGRKK